MGVSHIAVNFSLGHKGRYGVNHYDINRAGTNHRFRNLKRLLSVVRLGNIKVIHVHANIPGVNRVKRVFRVNEACNSSSFLNLGNHM